MATLEQELMADFADSGDEGVQDLETEFAEGDDEEAEEQMVDEEAEFEAEQSKPQKKGPADIRGAQNLKAKLQPVLKQIDEAKDRMEEDEDEEGEEDQLLKDANEFSTRIDDEITSVHKYIRDTYSSRFPYLEQLVKNAVDYARTVIILQNWPLDDIKTIAQRADNDVGVPLKNILDAATLMVVVVEGVNNKERAQGRDLNEKELELVVGACKLLLHLDEAKRTLRSYVQSRMNTFAPNLTVLVGSETAAQLISAVPGGLKGLAQTPACNIAPLGSNKASGLGLATNIGIRHQGFLFNSPILNTTRNDLKRQGMRIVAAKVILAARVDAVRSSRDGTTGQDLKNDCERRLDKLTEVGKSLGTRALPTPDDKPSRKRGGRRARKAKEATAMTEIRKAQNRMAFGKEEKEVGYGDSTKGMGMIGATDTGRLRAQQIDPKTRAKLSKKNPGWGTDTTLGAASSLKGFGAGGTATSLRAQGLRTGGVGLGGTGTSSIAFTPVQGLELVDPRAREEMKRKREADDDRWFKGGSFTQLNGGGSSKVDAGGFKVPALPIKKPKTDA
ncbi:Nop domain-containing protein [Clathrospora elynae]|uniref:Nop domain-containing protein n=1 Tax=Clathrospora elynae TaxID=706981 RepID=A0A6A5SQ62_9PLEO|nr:Nop domain-containing protein [Clathrospora elynae]